MTRFRSLAILGALVASLIVGLLAVRAAPDGAAASVAYVEPVGTLWLNGLRMTIIPLVVALLVTGITSAADAVRSGRLAARSVATFLTLLWSSAIIAAIAMPLLMAAFPLDPAQGAALVSSFADAKPVAEVPDFGDFLTSLVPTNPIAAAAEDAILPLILFTAIFAFAITRLPDGPRAQLTGFFDATGQAMLIVINWVLALAPLGVGALAYTVAVRSGGAAFGALLNYVLVLSLLGIIIWALAYVVAMVGARIPLGAFARATTEAQTVAISTQSSLVSLPAMLRGTQALGIPAAHADVVLPLAVALFRVTGPALNLGVALYLAQLFGLEPSGWQLAAAVAVAATTTIGAVSLPGQISFVTSIAPIALVLGVPVAPLVLLVAVETIPDIFRTLGNVTMDVAVTGVVSRRSRHDAPVDPARQPT